MSFPWGEAEGFCKEHGMDTRKILAADGFERLALLDDAVEAILTGGDESKKRFILLAGVVEKLYKAILPDPVAGEFGELRKLLIVLAEKVRSLAPPAEISGFMGGVEELLDRSVAAEGYVIRETPEGDGERLVNLGGIHFEALRARFERGRKRTVAETLRGRVSRAMVVDLLQFGYPTLVPRECVGDRAEAPHEANLFDIQAKYADVISVEETLAYLERVGAKVR